MMRILLFITTLLFLAGCGSKTLNTEDPQEAYRHWMGEAPPSNVTVLEGKYWKSPHWTDEFEVFLHLTADDNWKRSMIKKYNLLQMSQPFAPPANTPAWFKPAADAILYTPNGAHTGPFYFEDPGTRELYIYQIQY